MTNENINRIKLELTYLDELHGDELIDAINEIRQCIHEK